MNEKTGLKTVKKLPGVLSFSRRHVITDGEMFSRFTDRDDESIPVIRHGIRGTQNVIPGKGKESQKAAAKGEREVSNIQITETAKLDPKAETMVVRFGLSMLDIAEALDACVGKDRGESDMIRATIDDFVSRAKDSEGLVEVARRYARNIANARWLWRNRTIASTIEVTVSRKYVDNGKDKVEKIATFDAKTIPMNSFDDYSDDEKALGDEIAAQLKGESEDGLIVEALVTMRTDGNVEVFPSQNYVENKPKGFARPLYKIGHPEAPETKTPGAFTDTRVMGYAALRDQKIFNALRTIDTWYPSFDDTGLAIAVEPMGASLGMQE
ncbi:CRISPR-associated protein, Csy3 family, partial [hydrothermal vent metagenome]